ncbi:MAG: hypothetical protein B0A82_24690 [Alkalinema sp. CACIAM 70d]|nr:MAG: hypothetical protein B0A82_24690 [Alkalinema sp. CACIAM 70d]
MDITLSVYRSQVKLCRVGKSLAQTAASRKLMKDLFKTYLEQRASPYSLIQKVGLSSNMLKMMVRKYSEQLVYQPIEEIQFWFTYSNGVFLEPGYPPLYYNRKSSQQRIAPNTTAVGAIGEGIAGFLAQRLYQARKLARPTYDYPDIVMAAGSSIYLIEAKATTNSVDQMQQVIKNELGRLCVYVSGCTHLAPQTEVVGILMATALINSNTYSTYITEIQL